MLEALGDIGGLYEIVSVVTWLLTSTIVNSLYESALVQSVFFEKKALQMKTQNNSRRFLGSLASAGPYFLASLTRNFKCFSNTKSRKYWLLDEGITKLDHYLDVV